MKIDARGQQGETPFYVAIECNHVGTGGMADVLLQHHANINAQDSLGYTSLLQVIGRLACHRIRIFYQLVLTYPIPGISVSFELTCSSHTQSINTPC